MTDYTQDQDEYEDEPEEVCLTSHSKADGSVIGVVCVSWDTLYGGVMIPHGVYGTAYPIPSHQRGINYD